jgi:hypothetical protein
MQQFLLPAATTIAFWASLVTALPSKLNTNSLHYDMPMTWTPLGFTAQMTVGTPPQNLTSFVDWTWNSQYLLTTTCLGIQNNKDNCLVPSQQYFNQSQSSTFTDLSQQYPSQTWNPNHFFLDLDLTVDYAEDVQTVGPSSVAVRLQAGDFQFKQATAFPFSGVYGLSPVLPSANSKLTSTSPIFLPRQVPTQKVNLRVVRSPCSLMQGD